MTKEKREYYRQAKMRVGFFMRSPAVSPDFKDDFRRRWALFFLLTER